MATQYNYLPYTGTVNYSKFDIAQGLTSTASDFFYATQPSIGRHPNSSYSYDVSSWSREDNKVTLYFTKTGAGPDFAIGSLISVTGTPYDSANYTGMVINVGNGSVEYINRGYPQSVGASGLISSVLNPAWTTGFFFIPSYSSSFEAKTKTIVAQMGDGYSQRQRNGLNSNDHMWNLTFENRTDKETNAILNFIEDQGGVYPFKLLIPVGNLVNNPNLRYVANDPKVNNNSFNLNTTTATFTQVFDPI